jgi:FixJ family two-component response regulator
MPKQYAVVAVIDDRASTRRTMERLLSTCGFDTELYSSGRAFLDNADKSAAICLMVDTQLGDIGGIELARRLVERGEKTPVILVTASDTAEVRARALAAGCVALLPKPFTPGDLIKLLSRLRTG